MISDAQPELRIVAPSRSVLRHIADVWAYRELLVRLVRKELAVRYQKSVLGVAWSLAQPMFLMIIYTVVFKLLKQHQPAFPIWLLSGLLIWNFFGTAVSTGTQSVTSNAYLVGKVSFPREVLPLASVGASLIHLMFSGVVLVVVLGVTRHDVAWAYLWLLVPALLACTLLASALAIGLSALNVYARDTTHLLDLGMLAWFWFTPIVYPFDLVRQQLSDWGWWEYLHLLNPMTPIVIAFQRGIYGTATVTVDGQTARLLPDLGSGWYLRSLLVLIVVGIVALLGAIRLFDRAEANFAEVM